MVQNRFLAMQICNADRHSPRVYGDPCPEAKAKETDRIAYLDATFSSHTPLEIADVCHLCFFAPNKARSGAQTELLYCTNKQLRLGAHVSVF